MIPFSDVDARRHPFPVVNLSLCALNALVFLYALVLGGFGYLWGGGGIDVSVFFLKWGFIPHELTEGLGCTYRLLPAAAGIPCSEVTQRLGDAVLPNLPIIPLEGGVALQDIRSPVPTWATVFSSMFIHGGLFHFVGNMAFLWVFGNNIEGRLGHTRYLVFYLATGVAAAMSHWAISPGSETPLVGASGAIAGVMGAYLVLYPYNRIRALVVFFIITAVELSALVFLGIWFGLQVINSLGALGMAQGVSVAFMAHVGGFVCGALLMLGYKLLVREPIWPARRVNRWDFWYRAGRGPD